MNEKNIYFVNPDILAKFYQKLNKLKYNYKNIEDMPPHQLILNEANNIVAKENRVSSVFKDHLIVLLILHYKNRVSVPKEFILKLFPRLENDNYSSRTASLNYFISQINREWQNSFQTS